MNTDMSRRQFVGLAGSLATVAAVVPARALLPVLPQPRM